MIYLAINGDDVGQSIGQAILDDDHEALQTASNSIKDSHGNLDKWVESIGGKVVTSSGDESMYMVPEDAINELEQLSSQYKDSSGHSFTAGYGSTMSEASKALIYGKLNGKDQVVEYDPSIDEFLQQDGPEDTEEQLSDESDSDTEEGQFPEETEEDLDQSPEDAEADEEFTDADDAEVDEGAIDDRADEEDNIEEEAPDGYDIDPATASPETDEAEEDEEDFIEDPSESTPEDEDSLEDSVYQDMQGDDEEDIDDIDGEEQNDLLPDQEQDPELEQDQDQELDPELEQEGTEEYPPQEEDPAAAEAEGADQDPELQSLKDDIGYSLSVFKENKGLLDQYKQHSPELYDATIIMLRSMIAMAKMQGMSPEKDLQQQEMQQDMTEEMPDQQDAEMQDQQVGEEDPGKKLQVR